MRIKSLLLLCICSYLTISCKEDNILKLPITYQNGYGPFEVSGGGSIVLYNNDKDNPWRKTYLKVSGLPENWTDTKVGDIHSDIRQYVYQNYHLGDISKEWYDKLQKMWNWKPDTLNLSKEPIKCRAAFAVGYDSTGKSMVVVDTNNNYDFSDEEPFEAIQFSSDLDWNSLVNNTSIHVSFERILNNKKTQFKVPLLISSVNMDEYYLYCNFAQYGTVKLENHLISIHSFKFRDLSYDNVGITTNLSSYRKKVVFNNEYIEIGSHTYKNLGVKRNKDLLILEKINSAKSQLRPNQIGFKAIDFSGSQFKNQNIISLHSLKGKYVLLDFWGTWCGPCIQEIPNLKTLYDNTDKSKFEIISIVVNSPIPDLEQMMSKYGITWPQIISDDSNKIKEMYEINKYPSTFLIDPEGTIIAKDLRGKELEIKIENLIKASS